MGGFEMLKKSRGGGPKTLRGKKAISQNATKFGAYSGTFFVNQDKSFQTDLAILAKEMGAVSSIEVTYLESYLSHYYKKKKLETVFEAELEKELSKDFTNIDFRIHFEKPIPNGVLWIINNYRYKDSGEKELVDELPTEKTFKGIRELSELQEIVKKHPFFWEMLTINYNQKKSELLSKEEVLDRLAVAIETEDGYVRVLDFGMKLAKVFRQDYAHYVNNKILYQPILESILQSRRMRVLQNINFMRVFDDLERAMSRALNEFHRQKKYRLESNFMGAQEV